MSGRDDRVTITPIFHGGGGAGPPMARDGRPKLPEGQERRPTRDVNPPRRRVGEGRFTVRPDGQAKFRGRIQGGAWSEFTVLPFDEIELLIEDRPARPRGT